MYNSEKFTHDLLSSKYQRVVLIWWQNFSTSFDFCSPVASQSMASGAPISLANSLRARENYDFFFIGKTKTKPLSETNIWQQVFPINNLSAFCVANKVSMKKSCPICLYRSIQSLVEWFIDKIGSSDLLHFWVNTSRVLFAESKSILQNSLICSADIPLGTSV